MDRCVKIEHARLFGGLNWAGVNTRVISARRPHQLLLLNKLGYGHGRPDREYGFGTRAIHAGQIPDPATGARAAPIYQTTSFVFDSRRPRGEPVQPADLRQRLLAHLATRPWRCSRSAWRRSKAGAPALACATGQAAEMTAILALCKAGDHIVSASTLYGGTHTLLGVNLRKLGIETTFVDPAGPGELPPRDQAEYQAASTPKRSATR